MKVLPENMAEKCWKSSSPRDYIPQNENQYRFYLKIWLKSDKNNHPPKMKTNIGPTKKYGWNIPQNRFYLPAALAVPPSQFLVHSQFVFLFQVWSFCLSLSGLEIFKGIHPELDVRNSYIVNFTQLHLSTYSSVLDSLGADRWHRPSWTYFQHVHISSGDPLPI